MASTPLIKPSTPEFRAHFWSIRTKLTKTTELAVDIGTGTKVHCPNKVIESILSEVRSPVALEQSRTYEFAIGILLIPVSFQHIAYFANISFVFAIRAILIFHLNHDDRTTILNGQRSKLLCNLLFKNLHSLHEVRVLLTKADIFFLQKPPRQTSHLPLCAYIWTRTNDYVHTILLSQTTESSNIIIAGEIKLSLLLFMDIPEHIDANSIHAESLAHFYAMVPVSLWNTRVMNFGSLYNERVAIE